MDGSTMEHAIACVVAYCVRTSLAFRINALSFSFNFYNLGTCEIYCNLLKFISSHIIYFSLR